MIVMGKSRVFNIRPGNIDLDVFFNSENPLFLEIYNNFHRPTFIFDVKYLANDVLN